MPTEISVGPPVLTINNGATFMVTDLSGEITADSEQGVFAGDTRFLSYYSIFSNGLSWIRRTSSTTTYYSARIYLTNAQFSTIDGEVADGTLALVITRSVGDGVHEDLDISNFGLKPVRFNLEIALRSDFADIFEVKSHRFVRRGRTETEWDKERSELTTSYTNHDFRRSLIFRASSESLAGYANGRITFDLNLRPGAEWHVCNEFFLVENDRVRHPVRSCFHKPDATKFDGLQRDWLSKSTSLTSGNEDIYRLYRQSVVDMGALRLYDHDSGDNLWIPAAGVPWFVTLFGRDSLLVALQNMMVNPGFALGALKKLAEFQAAEVDDWRDAEPGKIPHEIRFGELAHFRLIPHTPYYGTADATPLYLIVLHEAWKWLGDNSLLRDYRDVALRCLEWIERYGDLDGDGFQEYRTRSKQGYENMGWKDSGDACVYPDGTQVRQPKALCELQGYVFDAWMRMSEMFDALGEHQRASVLRNKAADLQARFEQHFWCEDIGYYAFMLDPAKQPVRTIASNAGHLLWSGIASRQHATQVIKRLFEPDMWSGWGIRTLSARNPAYNPFSYQLGSVWPHDNGIIALGAKRYGFAAEAARIARDISEAASYFVGYRLPELYGGIQRTPGAFPVQYSAANVPQAWAAGSVFHLLRAILGLRADAPNRQLNVDAELPPWIPDLRLNGLTVGQAKANLHFWQEAGITRWEAEITQGELQVQEKRWQPWLEE
jgi:glycogen debranching enzyme